MSPRPEATASLIGYLTNTHRFTQGIYTAMEQPTRTSSKLKQVFQLVLEYNAEVASSVGQSYEMLSVI